MKLRAICESRKVSPEEIALSRVVDPDDLRHRVDERERALSDPDGSKLLQQFRFFCPPPDSPAVIDITTIWRNCAELRGVLVLRREASALQQFTRRNGVPTKFLGSGIEGAAYSTDRGAVVKFFWSPYAMQYRAAYGEVAAAPAGQSRDAMMYDILSSRVAVDPYEVLRGNTSDDFVEVHDVYRTEYGGMYAFAVVSMELLSDTGWDEGYGERGTNRHGRRVQFDLIT